MTQGMCQLVEQLLTAATFPKSQCWWYPTMSFNKGIEMPEDGTAKPIILLENGNSTRPDDRHTQYNWVFPSYILSLYNIW